MSAAFLIQVFGSPALRRAAGAAVGFGTRKHLGVLVFLALEGRSRAVSRDRLIDVFWPHVAAWRGRHSLSQALTVLRRALGRDAFSRGTSTIQLVAPVTTELDAVDHLRECDALDAPLDGVDAWAGTDLAHWVDATRVALKDRAAGILRDSIQHARRDGDVDRVFALAHRLYVVDPVSDLAVQAIAEDRLVHGDTIGALRLLRDHVARVERREECKPSTGITRLLRRLESGTALPVMAVPTRLAAAVERVRPSIFVGRGPELARLEASWSAAQDGRPRTVLVTSPGGIGKSALLRRFATGVSSRANPVHLVVCQEIAAGIPYAAVSDLLASLIRDPAVGGTDPTWLAEATRVFPALRARYPGVPQPPQIPPEMVCVRVAEAICRMIEAVAEDGAMLLAFDDVQHLDVTSRDVLVMIQKRLTGSAAMVLAAARSDYLGGSASSTERPQAILSWDDTVVLAPLADLEILRLVHALSPELDARPRVRDEIVTLAQGNPYFAEMLVADWTRHEAASLVGSHVSGGDVEVTWSPPDSMRSAFARHYEGLTETARHMLHVVAVARRGLSAGEIASSLGTTLPAIDTAVLETIERGLVRLDGPLVSFKNELHREYVYWEMPGDARRYHHGRLAQALERLAGEDAFGELLEAGRHFLDAGRTEEALGAVCEGARIGIAKGAPGEAQQALELVRRRLPGMREPTVTILLAESLSAQGLAQQTLDVLHQLGTRLMSPPESAEVEVLRAEALHRLRHSTNDELLTISKRAVQTATCDGPDELVIRAAQTLAEVASEVGLPAEMTNARTIAERLSGTSATQETRARAMMTMAYCSMMTGDIRRARDAFYQSAKLCRTTSNDPELARVLNGIAICHLGFGESEEAAPYLIEALSVAQRLGNGSQAVCVIGNLGVAYEQLGQFQEAEDCYNRALEMARRTGNSRRLVEAFINSADIAMIKGNIEAASVHIRDAHREADETNLWRIRAKVHFVEADLHLAAGVPELAWPCVESALRILGTFGRPTDSAGRWARLRDHYLLHTKGLGAIQASRGRNPLTVDSQLPQRIDALEYGLFREWAREAHGLHYGGPKLTPEVEQDGLLGIIGRLVSAGTFASKTTARWKGLTTAQVLEQAYPPEVRPHRLAPLAELLEGA